MSLKVMIVESDWSLAHQAEDYLESRAHHVCRVIRPAEALTKAEHWGPDLVIVSAEYTENGLLEELHALPQAPAVLLTGSMDRYDLAWRAWQRGGHELLLKPIFRTSEMRSAIITAMENHAAGTRIETPQVATA
ncbi:MAG: hypothetical protein ACLFVU_11050 [Phycisphaerae bacterium]